MSQQIATDDATAPNPDREADRAVLVIGAGSGIGRAIALDYIARGARVAVIGRTGSKLDRTVEMAGGHRIGAWVADVTDDQQLGAAIEAATSWLGGLEVAVNAAGVFEAVGPFGDLAPDDWARVIDINLNGIYAAMRHQVAAIRRTASDRTAATGAIVNVSSTFGPHARIPGIAAYAASKAAVSVLTKVAALDHVGEGIRINAVSPGPFDTEMSMLPGESPAERDRRLAESHPAGRAGTMAEIVHAVRYLASSEAGYHIGTDLVIDGGVTA